MFSNRLPQLKSETNGFILSVRNHVWHNSKSKDLDEKVTDCFKLDYMYRFIHLFPYKNNIELHEPSLREYLIHVCAIAKTLNYRYGENHGYHSTELDRQKVVTKINRSNNIYNYNKTIRNFMKNSEVNWIISSLFKDFPTILQLLDIYGEKKASDVLNIINTELEAKVEELRIYNDLQANTMSLLREKIDLDSISTQLSDEMKKPNFPSVIKRPLYQYDKLREAFHQL